jgi:steroid delta-isomerase-like uncharacterized protein
LVQVQERSEIKAAVEKSVLLEVRKMKRIAFAASVLVAVALASPALARNQKSTQPTRVVAQWFQAFNRHDADTIQRLYADDAVYEGPDYPMLRGNRAIADVYRSLFALIPDVTDTIKSMDRSGDKVFVEFVATGQPKGGARLTLRIFSVLEVRNGKVVRDATYYDRKSD